MTTVSVVIPTYNRAEQLSKCLHSLVEQTFTDFEVLICDDGSTDNTYQIVENFSRKLKLNYIWSNNFGGPARPRNIGIAKASGKYVAFLDSDDWWTQDKLEKSVQALENGYDLVYHDLYIVKQRSTNPRISSTLGTRQTNLPVFDDLLFNGNIIPNSSVVIRTSIIKSISGFSEDYGLIAAEDYDCWLRVAKITNLFYQLPQCLGFYLIGNDSISGVNKTLLYIPKILTLYSCELGKITPMWACYQLARAYYLKKEKIKFLYYFHLSIANKSSPKLLAKLIFMKLLI